MEAAVLEKLGPSSGPREKYFARFETYFNSLSKEEKEEIRARATDRRQMVAPEDDVTREFFKATKAFFDGFATGSKDFPRGDYFEMAWVIRVRKKVPWVIYLNKTKKKYIILQKQTPAPNISDTYLLPHSVSHWLIGGVRVDEKCQLLINS